MKFTNKYSVPRFYESILFLLLLSGPPKLRVRDSLDSISGVIDWSVLLSMFIWALGALWLIYILTGYLLSHKPFPKLNLIQKIGLIFIFSLGCSVLVSAAPMLSAYRVFQLFIMLLFGHFWIKKYGVESTLKHLFVGYTLLLVVIAVLAVIAPDLVYSAHFASRRLRGELIASTGFVSTLCIILALSLPLMKNRVVLISIIILSFILLILSMTRTAYVAMLFFLLLGLIRIPKSKILTRFIYMTLSVLPVIVAFRFLPVIMSWLIRESNTIQNLSDRIPLWQHVLTITMHESPFLGLGYYANRQVLMSYNENLGTSHSAFIGVLSGAGILGSIALLILLIPFLYQVVYLYLYHGRQPKIFTYVCMFFTLIIIGIVSENMLIASPTGFTFWLLVTLISDAYYNTDSLKSWRFNRSYRYNHAFDKTLR